MSAGNASLRILITNDDGVDAPGIALLRRLALMLSDDVWVVAPSANQSGAGHRFTFGHELVLDRREERVFAVNGTPADCVVAGCTHVLGEKRPDVVLAGVNHGQNLGDIIHCSGTLAGAREGAMQGAIGIALSQAVDYEREHDISWGPAERFGLDVISALIAEGAGPHTYYNVNFPTGRAETVTGVRVVPHQRFSRSPFRYYPSRNAGKFFVSIPETPSPLDPDHDFHTLHQTRAVTVTPLTLELTDLAAAKGLEERLALSVD